MQTISGFFLIVIACYLWGSLSPSFFVARMLKGIDLRNYGSANVGSSNIGQQLGGAWMIAVGTLDLAKGLLPIVLARWWNFDWSVVALVGIATVIGHNWSLYLGFRGGRGMAATIGILMGWDVQLAIGFLVILGVGWVLKQAAPACAVALVLLPPMACMFTDPTEIVWVCLGLLLIVALKRLEANRLPLPHDPKEKRAVLARRLWLDRDVASAEEWDQRGRIG